MLDNTSATPLRDRLLGDPASGLLPGSADEPPGRPCRGELRDSGSRTRAGDRHHRGRHQGRLPRGGTLPHGTGRSGRRHRRRADARRRPHRDRRPGALRARDAGGGGDAGRGRRDARRLLQSAPFGVPGGGGAGAGRAQQRRHHRGAAARRRLRFCARSCACCHMRQKAHSSAVVGCPHIAQSRKTCSSAPAWSRGCACSRNRARNRCLAPGDCSSMRANTSLYRRDLAPTAFGHSSTI